MLVFELTEDSTQLEIHTNEEGLEQLMIELNHLLGGEDHVHLKTPAWGGTELSPEPQGEKHKVIHHVKIFCWRK